MAPNRATVAAIKMNTAIGASFMSQPITIIESSLTPAKKSMTGRRLFSSATVAAAAKMMTAMIKGKRSPPPCAADANGFCGIMPISI